MSKKKFQHFHKYKRVTYPSKHIVYKCVIPRCTHFINAPLLIGREAACFRCGGPFIIKNLILAKLHCDSCTNKREKETIISGVSVDRLAELLS